MKFLSRANTPRLYWEKLKTQDRHVPDLYRSPIPGGWIISNGLDGGLTFIPDADHQWDGNSLPILE